MMAFFSYAEFHEYFHKLIIFGIRLVFVLFSFHQNYFIFTLFLSFYLIGSRQNFHFQNLSPSQIYAISALQNQDQS